MRTHVALLVAVFLACGVAAALAACGGTTLQDQPTAVSPETATQPVQPTAVPAETAAPVVRATAAPAETAAPVVKATAVPAETAAPVVRATATPAAAVDSAPALTPTPAADAGIEFMPLDSSVTLIKDEGITNGEQDRSKGGADLTGTAQGQTFTWEDGDRTLTAYLQADLVVDAGSEDSPREVVVADAGGGNVVRGAGGKSGDDTLPVFRSESGTLMTLPGGVLLLLDAEWSAAQVNSFFSSNGIKLERVSELVYAPNGFLVETEPGFPSLELANTLATQDGVEVSSPNWWRESVKK